MCAKVQNPRDSTLQVDIRQVAVEAAVVVYKQYMFAEIIPTKGACLPDTLLTECNTRFGLRCACQTECIRIVIDIH